MSSRIAGVNVQKKCWPWLCLSSRAYISPEEWDAILNMVVASTCHGSCS